MGFMKGALAAGEQAESDTSPPPVPPLLPPTQSDTRHYSPCAWCGWRAACGTGERCDRIRSLRRAAEYSICQNSLQVDIFIHRAPGVDNKTANANPARLMNHRWFPSVMRKTEGGGGVTAHPGPGFIIFLHTLRALGRSQRLPCVSQCFYLSSF